MINVPKKDLVKAAKELNDVMGLDPGINIKEKDIEKLAASIREAASLIVPEDELTDATTVIIEMLGDGDDEPEIAADEAEAEEAEAEEEVEAEEEAEEEAEAEAEEEAEEAEAEEAEAEEKAAPPVPATPKKKKGPKKAIMKNRLGHTEGSQAALIDEVLILSKGAPITVEDVASAVGCDRTRVRSHVKHLEKKGFNISLNADGIVLTLQE